jgi:hemerythrin-like domain-containing protein
MGSVSARCFLSFRRKRISSEKEHIMIGSHDTAPDPRQLLTAHHELLEKTYQQAELAAQARDRDGLRNLWTRLENLVLAHMAAEEAHLFPALERVDPIEVRKLTEEHSGLREQLAELGVGVDLHLVASPRVSQFMADLRSHAKREDALAYRWAAESLSPEAKTALAIELRRMDRAKRR